MAIPDRDIESEKETTWTQPHRLADLSVDYPKVTTHYRRIEEIKSDRGQNGLTTEEMRQTMVLCKELFEDLLGKEVTAVRNGK